MGNESIKFDISQKEDYRNSFIDSLTMERNENTIHIKLKINSLWNKQFKVEAKNKLLTLSALRVVSMDVNGRPIGKKFKLSNATIKLPFSVVNHQVETFFESGFINIKVPIHKINNSASSLNHVMFGKSTLSKSI